MLIPSSSACQRVPFNPTACVMWVRKSVQATVLARQPSSASHQPGDGALFRRPSKEQGARAAFGLPREG